MAGNGSDERVALRFQLGDRTLWQSVLRLRVVRYPLAELLAGGPVPDPQGTPPGTQGYLLRSRPEPPAGADVAWRDGRVRYVVSRYRRHYVDLRTPLEDYLAKFSPRSRSTLGRKVRRYAQACGGELHCRAYREAAEMAEFHARARAVSALTYQERLLDAGLPEGEGFVAELEALARDDRVRAWVLGDGERPVAYLCCIGEGPDLEYRYLGYDPARARWSPGTVLHRLAIEELLGDGRFERLDFTEGEGEHKRFFATGSVDCANVYLLRAGAANALRVLVHAGATRGTAGAAAALERLGIKARLRRWLRHRA